MKNYFYSHQPRNFCHSLKSAEKPLDDDALVSNETASSPDEHSARCFCEMVSGPPDVWWHEDVRATAGTVQAHSPKVSAHKTMCH